MSLLLPRDIHRVGVPPVKLQGIKTKLVPFIAANISWSGKGRWIEPFLGSGVVAFNIAPSRALLTDTNEHIITLYKAIQSREFNVEDLRSFLQSEGRKLALGGVEYYYEVRSRFNLSKNPFDFLFLNRSCFNGVMRFNKKGGFNTPFGHKPERFAQSYVTKICNQVSWIAKQMRDRDWEFRVCDWEQSLQQATEEDFIYIDPPYFGRHADYYNSWSELEAVRLASVCQVSAGGYALSMWLENKYRRNEHLLEYWKGNEFRTMSHFYHVGSSENLRNEMQEALVIKPGYAVDARAQIDLNIAIEILASQTELHLF